MRDTFLDMAADSRPPPRTHGTRSFWDTQYELSCQQYPDTYIRQTGRLGWIKEHKSPGPSRISSAVKNIALKLITT